MLDASKSWPLYWAKERQYGSLEIRSRRRIAGIMGRNSEIDSWTESQFLAMKRAGECSRAQGVCLLPFHQEHRRKS